MINQEILSLELERADLKNKISILEQFLDYADGYPYSLDRALLAEYKQRVTVIEQELVKLRDKVDVEKCEEAVKKLHDTLYTLNSLTIKGMFDWDALQTTKQIIYTEIEKLNNRCKYREQD